MVDPNKTIVRGADGLLYSLTTTGSLQVVPDDQAQEFLGLIPNLEAILQARFAEEIFNVAAGCHQTVRIVIPDIDLTLG